MVRRVGGRWKKNSPAQPSHHASVVEAWDNLEKDRKGSTLLILHLPPINLTSLYLVMVIDHLYTIQSEYLYMSTKTYFSRLNLYPEHMKLPYSEANP